MSFIINSLNKSMQNGLQYKVYNNYMNDNPNFFLTASLYTGSSSGPNNGLVTQIPSITTGTNNCIPSNGSLDNYSVQWIGYFLSNYTGTWTFSTSSDDCSYLWIGNNAYTGYTTTNAIVNNGGLHGMVTATGTVSLTSGILYPIRIQFGELSGGDNMIVTFSNPNLSQTSNGLNFYYNYNNFQ